MPWHASPKKSLRKDVRRRAVRKNRLSLVKTSVKKARIVLESSEKFLQDGVLTVQYAQSALAKAASRGVLHKRTAARRIGRLMKKSAKMLQNSEISHKTSS